MRGYSKRLKRGSGRDSPQMRTKSDASCTPILLDNRFGPARRSSQSPLRMASMPPVGATNKFCCRRRISWHDRSRTSTRRIGARTPVVPIQLRTLLTYVTLCAIAFSWLAVAIVEGRRERKAEVALGEMGYVVACSDHYRADWLGNYLGADILRHVRYVAAVRIHRGPNFLASAATKKTLADIRDLHQLEQLEIELDETRITDDDFENINGLDRLNELEIYGRTGMTDAWLAHLTRLSHLRQLPDRRNQSHGRRA